MWWCQNRLSGEPRPVLLLNAIPQFVYGKLGVDACPIGYMTIKDEATLPSRSCHEWQDPAPLGLQKWVPKRLDMLSTGAMIGCAVCGGIILLGTVVAFVVLYRRSSHGQDRAKRRTRKRRPVNGSDQELHLCPPCSGVVLDDSGTRET